MVKVITYGSYDKLHYGHIRLLERAKQLGDYLIVGVTSDDYDKSRGKINLEQPVIERIRRIRETGLADEIIVEEFEGQKIEDIQKYDVDIFAIGSDWRGKFDYLNEYCQVVYLERTEGISSSEIRAKENLVRMGFAGDVSQAEFAKYITESKFVNGLEITGVFDEAETHDHPNAALLSDIDHYHSFRELLDHCDAVYLAPHPENRYDMARTALENHKHVLCKSPIAMTGQNCRDLYALAKKNDLALMDAIKTGYSTAYNRLVLLAKGGKIGEVVSINAACTSLPEGKTKGDFRYQWNSIDAWGPIALLPVLQIFGTDYGKVDYIRKAYDSNPRIDRFTELRFSYPSSVASVTIGNGVKTEGSLVISGTKGYIYVPAPWWKTDYFEIRFEDAANNKRYFYQLDGEGIRNELVAFIKEIKDEHHYHFSRVDADVSVSISKIVEDYYQGNHVVLLS